MLDDLDTDIVIYAVEERPALQLGNRPQRAFRTRQQKMEFSAGYGLPLTPCA
ncbi:MAG: hypothetical protein ABSH35_26905 [Isosphaeraceae bacterium]|jgi:hypothetical protein